MLICKGVGIEFNGRLLFKDVDLKLTNKQRYAVIGANGSGKSTFLKVLARELSLSSGVINVAKGATIGLLRQDHFQYRESLIIDVTIAGSPKLFEALSEKEQLLTKETMTSSDGLRLARLEHTIQLHQGYDAVSRCERLLMGLGIKKHQLGWRMNQLSGGYQLRVLLAQVLFANPDILLLDEPTNHLDIVSISWLIRFLKEAYRGILIFVSHDRGFIDQLSTCILDIDFATITPYLGDYACWSSQKEATQQNLAKELAGKKKKIASMQRYVDRFRSSANRARQAQARLKMIQRINLPDILSSSRVAPNFAFNQARTCGKQVLKVENLAKVFSKKLLFSDVSFNLSRGDKCAIVGPNGVGKSTLLRLLLQQIPKDEGEIVWGNKVDISYFSQDLAELLEPDKTLLQWLEDQGLDEITAYKVLGKMLFSGNDCQKRIEVLSGGESARLIFADILAKKANVIILDEPTNHLSLEAIDSLIAGLVAYRGTVLFVSHNRYFVDKLASRLLIITPGEIDVYLGNYREFIGDYGDDYLETVCDNLG